MAVLNYHNFDTLGFTTGTEGPNQFYSDKQVGGGREDHIELSSNFSVIGNNSLKVMLEEGVYRDDYPLSRSELRTQVFGGNPGVMQGWYSFSFLTNSLNLNDGTVVISQLWDGGSPSLSIRYRYNTNQIFLRKYDNSSSVDYQLGTASLNTWTNIDMWYQARTNSTGRIKIWVNGTLQVNFTGQTIFTPETDSQTPYWKLGAYDSSFGERGISAVTFYFDAVSYHDDSDSEADTLAWINNFRSGSTGGPYTITVNSGTGGTATGGGEYAQDYPVFVEATANYGFSFQGWYEGVTFISSSNPYNFNATEDITLTAQFTQTIPTVTPDVRPSIVEYVECPITLPEQKYICPSNAVNGDNVGRVSFNWFHQIWWNEYHNTNWDDNSYSFSKVSGSANFSVNSNTGEITVSNISGFTANTSITVRVSLPDASYMDTVCTIIRTTTNVYFDPTYNGSNGTSNGTRSRPYLRYKNSGLGNGTPGTTYLYKRGTVTTGEEVILVSPMVASEYPAYMNFGAWGQGTRPVIDGTGTVGGKFMKLGTIPTGNDPINTDLECNNVRVFDIETTQNTQTTWYSYQIMHSGDNLEFHRLKCTNTNYDHGFFYFVSSLVAGNIERNIYLQSIEIYEAYHRGIKFESGGVFGQNFRCINTSPTQEHPAPNAAYRANVYLQFIDSRIVSASTNNLGLQVRSNGHWFDFARILNYSYGLTTWVHDQSIDDPENEIYDSGFKNIIIDGATNASYFGRHSGTADNADGILFKNIHLKNCIGGLQVSQGAINTLIENCLLSDVTSLDGVRVYSGAGTGTKIHHITAVNNAGDGIQLDRSDVEVKNSIVKNVNGTLGGTSSNNVVGDNSNFVNYANGDYRVLSTSSIVDSAPSLGYAYDITSYPWSQISVTPGALAEIYTTITYYTITVNNGPGGTSTGGGTIEDGEQVTLTATPNENYEFDGWFEGGDLVTTNNPYIFNATQDRTIQAIFSENIEPPLETFTVTATAGSGGSVSGGGDYEEGTSATLTATPNTGYEFLKWSDNSIDNPLVFIVNGDVTIQALFQELQPAPTYFFIKGRFKIV